MDVKLKRKLAKERSLVLKLTPKQINEILKMCGYVVNNHIYDEYGEHITPISRYYDKDADEYVILIRCKQHDEERNKLLAGLSSSLAISNLVPFMSLYDSSIVLLKDYSFCEISINKDNSLENNTKYAKYMYNLFGEYYRKKYNQIIKKEAKQENKER